jgi:DNA polymerase III subunit epsilon
MAGDETVSARRHVDRGQAAPWRNARRTKRSAGSGTCLIVTRLRDAPPAGAAPGTGCTVATGPWFSRSRPPPRRVARARPDGTIPEGDTPVCHAPAVGAHGHWHDGELLGFDLETTGVDRHLDVPVSFALVSVVEGVVVTRDTGLVDPGRPIPAAAVHVHGITTERARAEGRPLSEAVAMLSDALVLASERGVPVVGMKLDYDLTILDVQCREADGRGLAARGFAGPVLDALVLDRHFDRFRKGRRTLSDLCAHYGVPIANAHDAAADAEATIGVLTAMCGRYPELCTGDPVALHRSQIAWHRDWALAYDKWRRGRGMSRLDPEEYDWPLPAELPPAAVAV